MVKKAFSFSEIVYWKQFCQFENQEDQKTVRWEGGRSPDHAGFCGPRYLDSILSELGSYWKILIKLMSNRYHLNNARCQTIPKHQWVICSCSNLCILADSGMLHWAWLQGSVWVQVCSMSLSSALDQQASWGISSQENGQMQDSKPNHRHMSSLSLPHRLLLVKPKDKWPGPLVEGTAGTHGKRYGSREGWKMGLVIHLTSSNDLLLSIL